MKETKRLFSVILCIAIILSVSACGKPDARPTEDQTTLPSDQIGAYPDSSLQETGGETVYLPPTEAPQTTEAQLQTEAPATQAPATEAPPTQPVSDLPASTEVPQTQSPAQSAGAVIKYTSSYNGEEQAVFYPRSAESSKGTYPIVSWANGTGVSYTFYEKLLEAIAEGGYIVVANTVTMAADGKAQMNSIDFIISENSNSSSPLYKKINTNKIAVSGHSQGGRCAVNVASLDSRVSCVLSVAGSNFIEEAEKNNLPSLFLTGTNDWIVGSDKWVKPAYEACTSQAVYASYIGGTHTTCCSDIESYSYYSIKWFDAYLKNDTSAKKIFQNGGELSNDSKWQDFMCKGF